MFLHWNLDFLTGFSKKKNKNKIEDVDVKEEVALFLEAEPLLAPKSFGVLGEVTLARIFIVFIHLPHVALIPNFVLLYFRVEAYFSKVNLKKQIPNQEGNHRDF